MSAVSRSAFVIRCQHLPPCRSTSWVGPINLQYNVDQHRGSKLSQTYYLSNLSLSTYREPINLCTVQPLYWRLTECKSRQYCCGMVTPPITSGYQASSKWRHTSHCFIRIETCDSASVWLLYSVAHRPDTVRCTAPVFSQASVIVGRSRTIREDNPGVSCKTLDFPIDSGSTYCTH